MNSGVRQSRTVGKTFTHLRDTEPLVRQLHGLSGVFHGFNWIPCFPVRTQALNTTHREKTDINKLYLKRTDSLDVAVWRKEETGAVLLWPGRGERRVKSGVPGAQLSTSAPRAFPFLQSWLKLVMGRSGTLFWIQPKRRCFGVLDSPWKRKRHRNFSYGGPAGTSCWNKINCPLPPAYERNRFKLV